MEIQSDKREQVVKAIAYYHLITTTFGIAFYAITLFSDKAQIPAADYFEMSINTALGLAIFYGLSRKIPWGWQLTVVATPLSWLYGIYQLSQVYQPGSGFIVAMFMFLDIVILKVLFDDGIMKLFQVETKWKSLMWIRTPLLLAALFFLTLDFIGNQGAVIAALLLFSALHLAKKYAAGGEQDNE